MRIADLRPGWDTDFILHRFGAEIEHRQPASRIVAIGVAAAWDGRALKEWTADGVKLVQTRMLQLVPGSLRAPVRAARGPTAVRRLDLAAEAEALYDLEGTDADAFEPESYRAYLRLQGARYRSMEAAGLLHWFGLFCDGHLAATCGLMRSAAAPGASARFQRVVTHPAYRRRGLCSALVNAVGRFALGQWGAGAVYMAAEPEDVAIGIYRTIGWHDLSSAYGLQRNAPEDRGT